MPSFAVPPSLTQQPVQICCTHVTSPGQVEFPHASPNPTFLNSQIYPYSNHVATDFQLVYSSMAPPAPDVSGYNAFAVQSHAPAEGHHLDRSSLATTIHTMDYQAFEKRCCHISGCPISLALASHPLETAFHQDFPCNNCVVANGGPFNPSFVALASNSINNSVAPNNEQIDPVIQSRDNDNYRSNSFTSAFAVVSKNNDTSTDSEINASASTNSSSITRSSIISKVSAKAHNAAARLACRHPGCTTTVARAGELRRHIRKHQTPHLSCLVNNCSRKGDNGFYRSDKLRDHLRCYHRLQNGDASLFM